MNYLDLNDREAGSTVFIVGAGPQLARLPETILDELSRRPTIGVNLTQYKVKPRYFISAYVDHHILARARTEQAVHLHMRLVDEPALLDFLLPLLRRRFALGDRLHKRLSPDLPFIYTMRNVALAATHLAFILGARRVVFVGVEQENAAHFYDYDDESRRLIEQDLEILKEYPDIDRDHSYTTYDVLRAALQTPRETLEAEPFRERHTAIFAEYREQLAAAGVDIYSTAEESVLCTAGAPYLPIEDCLALQ